MAPDEGLKCFNAIELAIFCSTCSDSTYYSDVFPSLIDVYDYTYIFDQALDTNLTRMEIETDMFMILDADSDKYLKLGTGAKVYRRYPRRVDDLERYRQRHLLEISKEQGTKEEGGRGRKDEAA